MRHWVWVGLAATLAACDMPDPLIDTDGDGFFANAPDPALVDCDDHNPLVHPNAREVCDGLDNDCDGTVDGPNAIGTLTFWPDLDADGFGVYSDTPIIACEQPRFAAPNRLDCDDADASIYPGAPERCNGLDDNCDGNIDEGLAVSTVWYADLDGDGFGGGEVGKGCATDPTWVSRPGDCNDLSASIHPGALEVCNGIDDNCDGRVDDQDPLRVGGPTWYADADGDSYGDILAPTNACNAPMGTVSNALDCDDTRADISPESIWYRDQDADGYGDASRPWPESTCTPPVGYVLNADDCDDEDPRLWRTKRWYADTDGDGFGHPTPVATACHPAAQWVDNGLDCDDRDPLIHPGVPEVCDGIDNDCNGLIDDDDPAVLGQLTWYADTDRDGIGVFYKMMQACFQPDAWAPIFGDCDDKNPDIGAGAIWYRDFDRDGWGDDADTIATTTCEPYPGRVPRGGDCDDHDFNLNPDTPWFTDADGDGVGAGHIPVARGCVAHDGLAQVGGDCDDQDPFDDEGGCYSLDPQGLIDLTIHADADAARYVVKVQCTGAGSALQDVVSVTLTTAQARTTFTRSGVNHDYGGSCLLSVTLPSGTSPGNDPSGDGFLVIDVSLCGEPFTTGWSPKPNGAGALPLPVPSCSGCTDPSARNFDPDALISEPVCYT